MVLLYKFYNYFFYESLVALSRRFIIEKTNIAERRQQTTNIAQSCHKSSLPQKKLPTNKSLLPTAVASSHPPCITPWNLVGATFETKDNPIGLRNNSAIVKIR